MSSGSAYPPGTDFPEARFYARKTRRLISFVAVSTSNTTPTHCFSFVSVCSSSRTIVLEKFWFLKYWDSLFSPMFTIPLKYSIRERSESSAAALLKKSSSVCVRVQYDLHGVDHCRFSTSGMSGKEIDSLIKSKYFSVYVMPVIQADFRERFERLFCLHCLPPR